MNNKTFVLGAIVIASASFGVIAFKNSQQSSPGPQKTNEVNVSTTQAPVSGEFFIRPHSPRSGNEMARVVVVEWLDPECEACRAIHPAIKRIISEYSDRVLFVTRFMPYHDGSMYAASVLYESKERGKLDEALTTLFDKQPEWGDHRQPRSDLIPSYLTKLGIPGKSLVKEEVIAKHGDKVKQDKEDGERVGVQGTPSFYVNQKPLSSLGEQQLREMIDRELSIGKN